MSERVKAVADFDVVSWDQTPYDGAPGGPALAEAVVGKAYRGDLEGTGEARLLMCRAADEGPGADEASAASGPTNAGYVASEQFVGRLAGREGSFVIQHWGVAATGAAPWTAGHVVPGSGTGELAGLTGTVEIAVDAEGKHTLALDYSLPGTIPHRSDVRPGPPVVEK